MEEKYTKKASARILKEVLKINPKVSGFTTFDQAFVILMDYWDLELSIETSEKMTTCVLYRDGDKVTTWELQTVWDTKIGDWDWNTIYKTVLEDIIKERLYKRPKLGKRALKKLEEEKIAKQREDENKLIEPQTTQKPNIDELRQQRSRLAAKISDWKKKGADYSTLEEEYNKIREQIKNLK